MGKAYIKTTINFIFSDIDSSPSTSIQILVYFGHILLFAYNFGYRLCMNWVYMYRSLVGHPVISTTSPNGTSSFELCQSGQV